MWNYLPGPHENMLRLLQLLPLLRIFSQVNTCGPIACLYLCADLSNQVKVLRRVIVSFLRSASVFFNLLVLLLLIIDVYAAVGVFLFAGRIGNAITISAGFNSYGVALISLFQCL